MPDPIWNFNPRSDERSDISRYFAVDINIDFNPRSDERSDVKYTVYNDTLLISIHAPTNGATDDKSGKMGFYKNFNPRSDERSDRKVERHSI